MFYNQLRYLSRGYPNNSRKSRLDTLNPKFLTTSFFRVDVDFVEVDVISFVVPCLANLISNFRPSRITPEFIAEVAISLLSNVTNPNPIDNFSPFELGGFLFRIAILNPGKFLNAFVSVTC